MNVVVVALTYCAKTTEKGDTPAKYLSYYLNVLKKNLETLFYLMVWTSRYQYFLIRSADKKGMSTCGLVSRVHRTPTRWLAPSPHQQNKQTQARRKRREGDHKWFIPQQRPKIETSVSTFVSHTHCPVVGIQPATRARRKNCHTPAPYFECGASDESAPHQAISLTRLTYTGEYGWFID